MVWSRVGSAGQRRVQAPGKNYKQYGFGLVDWRDGHLDFPLTNGRRAAPLVAQLRRAAAHSRQRGRIAMVILDNLGIHTPKGSRLLRALLAELGEDLVLVYTPTYDPDANRIEWLWRALRRTVTHTHQRQRLADLVADADRWARTVPAAKVPSQIGSPFAPDQQPAAEEELNHAAHELPEHFLAAHGRPPSTTTRAHAYRETTALTGRTPVVRHRLVPPTGPIHAGGARSAECQSSCAGSSCGTCRGG